MDDNVFNVFTGNGLPPHDVPPGPPPEDDGSNGHIGLLCHRCGCRHFRVIYTRRRPSGDILRRRECRHCGTRIVTIEKHATEWDW